MFVLRPNILPEFSLTFLKLEHYNAGASLKHQHLSDVSHRWWLNNLNSYDVWMIRYKCFLCWFSVVISWFPRHWVQLLLDSVTDAHCLRPLLIQLIHKNKQEINAIEDAFRPKVSVSGLSALFLQSEVSGAFFPQNQPVFVVATGKFEKS